MTGTYKGEIVVIHKALGDLGKISIQSANDPFMDPSAFLSDPEASLVASFFEPPGTFSAEEVDRNTAHTHMTERLRAYLQTIKPHFPYLKPGAWSVGDAIKIKVGSTEISHCWRNGAWSPNCAATFDPLVFEVHRDGGPFNAVGSAEYTDPFTSRSASLRIWIVLQPLEAT